MLLDHHGQPLRLKADTREIAVPGRGDRYSTYPSRGLTPGKLSRILREAESGDIYRQMELFEEIEEKDTHLMSVIGTRKNAVLGAEYEVIPWSDDAADQDIAAFVSEVLFGLEDFDEILMALLDAIGKGFAVAEIMWDEEALMRGKAIPRDLLWRHQKKFCYDEADVLRVITDERHWPGDVLPANKFIVHRYAARCGYKARAGLFRTCVWMYLFKNYTLKDWVAFAEVYGMPIRIGKYEPSASQEDRDKLIETVRQIGADAAGVISRSTEIQFVEAMKADGKIYENLAKFCNAEISKAVLGQTQTSEIVAAGSLASAKVHEEVRQDILEADCKSLAKTIRRDLIRPLILFNFGEAAARRLPALRFNCEKSEDQEKTAKVYAALAGMGLPLSTIHIYEKFGIPKPEAGEELLPAPAAAPPDPFKDAPPPAPVFTLPPVLQANSQRDAFTKEQRALEGLADESIKEAAPVMKELAAPILALAGKAASLEELRDGLLKIYPSLDTRKLEDLTARAMFIADLYGRAAATDE